LGCLKEASIIEVFFLRISKKKMKLPKTSIIEAFFALVLKI
jgi:hypothetical protein